MNINIDNYKKQYWNYYLGLEEELINTRKYVSFDNNNFKTYSTEFIKLLDVTCSEIDVIAKAILNLNKDKYTDYKDIASWGYHLQQLVPSIQDYEVMFDNELIIKPFDKWKYEQYIDKKGNTRIRLVKNYNTPEWWTSYNKVKHHRTDSYRGGFQFYRANLENVINAFAALYILELILFNHIAPDTKFIKHDLQNSKLFIIQDEILQNIIKFDYLLV